MKDNRVGECLSGDRRDGNIGWDMKATREGTCMRYIVEGWWGWRVPHINSPQKGLLDDDIIDIQLGDYRVKQVRKNIFFKMKKHGGMESPKTTKQSGKE